MGRESARSEARACNVACLPQVHSAAENWEGVMSVVRAGSMPARAFARVVRRLN